MSLADQRKIQQRAVVELRRKRWTTPEILAALQISLRTLRRHEAEIKMREARYAERRQTA